MLPLHIEGLAKQYPQSNFQLGPIDLSLKAGASLAIFGKNGAGKSTLFQMLSGHLRPDSGKITLFGELMNLEAFTLKRRIGYLPQHLDLPRWVSGFDIVTYALRLYAVSELEKRRNEVLRYWDCESYAHKPIAACSYGMQKRVGLAIAMLHDPDLLILDEPFSGLDLFHIRALENLLEERRARKVTIISTHVAAYAAKLNDCAVSLQDGKLKTLSAWPDASFVERIELMESEFFPRSSPKQGLNR